MARADTTNRSRERASTLPSLPPSPPRGRALPHDDGTCSRLEYEDESPLDLIAGGQGRSVAGTHRSADVALWVLVGLFLIGAVCALVASEEVGGAVTPASKDDAAFGANDEHRIR